MGTEMAKLMVLVVTPWLVMTGLVGFFYGAGYIQFRVREPQSSNPPPPEGSF